MNHRIKAAMFAAAIAVGTPVAAQVANDTMAPADSQPSQSDDTIWNVIGAFGLIGLFGLFRPSDNDGYTNDPI